MNTQTHLLLAAALLARPGRPRANAAVLAGAIVPDAAVALLFAWGQATGVGPRELWGPIYFGEPMQTVQAVSNAVPLYTVLLLIGLAWGERRTVSGWRDGIRLLNPFALFALAALVHLAGDLPLHADDAHRHFWPLTDWRFHSPVSYWDPAHHGTAASLAEGVLGVALCVMLWRRFRARWVRALIALAAVIYVAVPLYWSVTMGAA